MNIVDVVIVAGCVLGAVAGLRRGFIVEVANILGAFVAFGVARIWYKPVQHALHGVAPSSTWVTALSYLIVFLAVWGAINVVARLARRIARVAMLGWADRFGGLLVGLLQSALVLELLLYLGRHWASPDVHRVIAQSSLAPMFVDMIPYLNKLFPHMPS